MIPGSVISLLTFPGVVVHEIAHRFFCDISRVPVRAVCYFRFGNPAGYVIHDKTTNLKHSFLISVGPLILNSVLCVLLTFPYGARLALDVVNYPAHVLLLTWVGLSIGMHAFPSNDDIQNFVEDMKEEKIRGLFYFTALVFKGLIVTANALRFFWFDLFYAFGLAIIGTNIVTNLF